MLSTGELLQAISRFTTQLRQTLRSFFSCRDNEFVYKWAKRLRIIPVNVVLAHGSSSERYPGVEFGCFLILIPPSQVTFQVEAWLSSRQFSLMANMCAGCRFCEEGQAVILMMPTLLLMRPEASLQGITRLHLIQIIQGATLTILVLAPPMLGAPSVIAG